MEADDIREIPSNDLRKADKGSHPQHCIVLLVLHNYSSFFIIFSCISRSGARGLEGYQRRTRTHQQFPTRVANGTLALLVVSLPHNHV